MRPSICDKTRQQAFCKPPEAVFGSNAPNDPGVDVLWARLLETDIGRSSLTSKDHSFVHIDSLGRASMLAVERHDLLRLGCRHRDLILVDPTLPLPVASVLLVRARALVINLAVGPSSSIRMVICENQVYILGLPKATDPAVTAMPTTDHPLVRLLCHALTPKHHKTSNAGKSTTVQAYSPLAEPSIDGEELPYTLRALDVALTAALGLIDADITDFESWAYPAVEALMHRVDRDTLEDVHTVKSYSDKVRGRVERLRQELEELLEDDEDLNDMYLRRRAECEEWPPLCQPWEDPNADDELFNGQNRSYSHSSESRLGHHRDQRHRRHQNGSRSNASLNTSSHHPANASRRRSPVHEQQTPSQRRDLHRVASGNSISSMESFDMENDETHPSEEADAALEDAEEETMLRSHVTWDESGGQGGGAEPHRSPQPYYSSKTRGGYGMGPVSPHDIEEAEDLLENAYVRADLLLRRVALLDERVEDTEGLLALDLDKRRNEIVTLNVVVSAVAAALGLTAALGGIFGMNLFNIELEDDPWALWGVIIAMIVLSAALFLAIMWYMWRKKLLFVPTTL